METFLVDFSPVTTMLVQIAAAALLAALTVGARYLFKVASVRLGMDIEKAQREKIFEALENSMGYAQARVSNYITARDNMKVRNELVAHGAEYVISKVPEALSYLDVDEDSVRDLVESRLAKALSLQGIVE